MKKAAAYAYLAFAIVLMLLWFLVGWGHASAPTIVIKDVEAITVTFDPGAVMACTVFYEASVTEKPGDPNFPDGHYKPEHCFFLEPKDTGYTDDWNFINKYNDDWTVWAEVQYPDGTGGSNVVSSNKVKVHR